MTFILNTHQPFKTDKLLNFDHYTSKRGIHTFSVKRVQLLKKYFPKYHKKITVLSRNGPYISKLKRAKIIQDFEGSQFFRSRQDWKLLFGNKSKSLKILHSNHQSPLQFENKIKFFSNLPNIKITMPPLRPSRTQPAEDRSLNKACKQLRYLKSLKNLDIHYLSNKHKNFLHQLSSLSTFLSSLKRLGISFGQQASCEYRLLEMVQSNKNLLKYITHLNLGSLCSPDHYQSFQGLTGCCANLESLSFEFSCRSIFYNLVGMKRFSENCFAVETNYLGVLATFPNLKLLSLDIADTFTFLKDFALPASVQHLRLNFEECLSKEIMLKLENNFMDTGENDVQVLKVFEENQTLIPFYERFQELSDLETLEILFSGDSGQECYKYQTYLFQNILKRIPSVKNISFKFSTRHRDLNKSGEYYMKDMYLPKFLASCPHETLETLEVGDSQVFYSNFGLTDLRNKFTKLSTITITGRFDDEDYASNNGIFPFLKEIITLGESIKKIRITTVGSYKVKSLLDFAKQIELLNMPNTLGIHLKISLSDGPREPKDDCENAIVELNKIKQENLRKKRFFAKLFCSKSAMFVKDFLDALSEKSARIKVFDCLAPIN